MDELRARRRVAAPAEAVYDLVTDITRMGEWSPESTGGEWLDGATGPVVDARFKGSNRRKQAWSTTATVSEAERGVVFAFVVGRPERPDTRWRYAFTPVDGGCEATETCEILREPGRVGRLLWRFAAVPWSERPADITRGMRETLRNLAAAAETQTASKDA